MGICAECGGIGLLREQTGTGFVSRPCGCQAAAGALARLRRAAIPREYERATLSNFEQQPHTARAWATAVKFVEEFIPGNRDIVGLLLTGNTGTGKTHLAVGMLRRLIEDKGIDGRFVETRELLDRLRNSYHDNAQETQEQILRPLWAADLVVMDDLGATRPTDWAFETLELVIGGFYNRQVTTIVTTNLPNLPAGGAQGNGYERAARPETLGDRIGARMWSRLQAMCAGIEIKGTDWRVPR